MGQMSMWVAGQGRMLRSGTDWGAGRTRAGSPYRRKHVGFHSRSIEAEAAEVGNLGRPSVGFDSMTAFGILRAASVWQTLGMPTEHKADSWRQERPSGGRYMTADYTVIAGSGADIARDCIQS